MTQEVKRILKHLEQRKITIGSIVKGDNGKAKVLSGPKIVSREVICKVIYTTGRFKGETTENFRMNEFV